MEVKCEVCDTVFTFLVEGESFGMTEGTDYNLHKINCPNLDCHAPILIKTIIFYDTKVEKNETGRKKWNVNI